MGCVLIVLTYNFKYINFKYFKVSIGYHLLCDATNATVLNTYVHNIGANATAH